MRIGPPAAISPSVQTRAGLHCRTRSPVSGSRGAGRLAAARIISRKTAMPIPTKSPPSNPPMATPRFDLSRRIGYPERFTKDPRLETLMAEQYIFTIENLSKFYNKREVLKNIWLAFYPGAKIGVIGSNG